MIIQQPVVSENRGHEGYWIAFLCAFILVIGALLLPYNSVSHEHESLQSHQVLITELTPPPLSMIAELRLAHEEIRYFYEANQAWLSVQQLQADWIAPFVKDKSWSHQGEHQWSQVVPGIYQSKPAQGGPRYLLNSQDQALDIWIDFKNTTPQTSIVKVNANAQVNSDVKAQSNTIDTTSLIKAGWAQVVFESEQNASEHGH